MATIMPANPIIEPIDKSNSPAIIKRQAPTAMRPRYADTCDQFMIPSRLNIPDAPAANPNTAKTSTVPEIAANSGRFKMCPNRDSRRMRSSAEGGPGVIGDDVDTAPPRDSAVLPGILEHLGEVFLRDEAGTRADVAWPIVRSEPVGREPLPEPRIRLENLADLGRIGRVVRLRDSQHGDRDVSL